MNQSNNIEVIEAMMFEFEPQEVLPYDGQSIYYGPIFSLVEANSYFKALKDEIIWEHDKVVIFGKQITTKRQVAWYGDEPYVYHYSNSEKVALPWTKTLMEIKNKTEEVTNETYNSCLLNFYEDGNVGMGWHSDDEKELEENGAIASISFGAERRFDFRHRDNHNEKVKVPLHHGSCLVMKGITQKKWHHQIAKSAKVISPRINLTFRTIR